MYFKETGKTATGLTYETWERGPVPKKLYEELPLMKADLAAAISIVSLGNFQQIKAKGKFQEEHFTPKQMKLLEKVAFIFKEAKAEDMTEISHLKNTPWATTLKNKGMHKEIDYLLAVDGSPGCISPEDACEIRDEIAEMHNIFGTA